MDIISDWKRKLCRPASKMIIGGKRPPESPYTSWFGRVTLSQPGEDWPTWRGRPMAPLIQILVDELPFKPSGLADISIIQVYIDPEDYGLDAENGEGWLIKTFRSLSDLSPVHQAPIQSSIKAFPGSWVRIDQDFPSYEDLPPDFPDELDESYFENFEHNDGTKVGGWPTNIQSEIFWGPLNRHPIEPEYLFQIDSEPKAGWAWGDGGVGYFGRGTGRHRDKWAMSWQCL